MNRVVRWTLALAVLPLAACTRNEMAQAPAAPPPAAAPAPAPVQLSQADALFIAQAAESNMAEVQAGQLAAQRATTPALRDFAQLMVNQHGQVNQQLMQLAQSKGVTPPESLAPAYQRTMDRLERAHGRSFDRDYVQSQIAAHRAAIALYRREAQHGQDPDLRGFAMQTLPVLQQHLHEAETLKRTHYHRMAR